LFIKTIQYTREQEKLHSVRYKETLEHTRTLGTVYVGKKFLEEMGNPNDLWITISDEPFEIEEEEEEVYSPND
jgi:hypothetical protein